MRGMTRTFAHLQRTRALLLMRSSSKPQACATPTRVQYLPALTRHEPKVTFHLLMFVPSSLFWYVTLGRWRIVVYKFFFGFRV